MAPADFAYVGGYYQHKHADATLGQRLSGVDEA